MRLRKAPLSARGSLARRLIMNHTQGSLFHPLQVNQGGRTHQCAQHKEEPVETFVPKSSRRRPLLRGEGRVVEHRAIRNGSFFTTSAHTKVTVAESLITKAIGDVEHRGRR